MEKKNKKLMILVAVLLVGIGVSFAYFVSSTLFKGEGAIANFTISEINGAELKVEGILNLDDAGIYPGHKNIASVKVTATGDNELIPYNLVWSGTNTINTPLEFTVYKTSAPVDINASCTVKTKVVSGVQQIGEECIISNLENLGNEIANGTINRGDTKATLISDEFITAVTNGISYYYYIIIEYPNLDEEQNEDINGVLNGKIKAEESSIKPDINILAAYIIQDNGEYKQVDDIPQSGYVINSSKSTCSNGAIPSWKDNGLFVSSLTKSGTSCYLYFDKKTSIDNVNDLIAKVQSEAKTTVPDFSAIADSDEGVYSTSDGMYNGTTYYWRGAATTNHVIFANKCWRIVRINGDKTMRLIYNGTPTSGTCADFGSGAVIMGSTNAEKYYATSDGQYNNASYVGWTYSLGSQRTQGGTASNAKTQTENWYKDTSRGNLTAYESKIVDGKYCNDRDMKSGSSFPNGGTGSTTQYYAGYGRLVDNKVPTLDCPNGDVYTLKVGAITADEVAFAGGVYGQTNGSYYLKGDNYYWTMSPFFWNGTKALVFDVDSTGSLSIADVDNTNPGLRPVINLKADTTFATGGTGTQNNPYVVQ